MSLTSKQKPPFPAIPSYPVSGLVLAFYGFSDQVTPLLNKLSINSKSYIKKHQSIIEAFVAPWPPCITRAIDFGGENSLFDCRYPSKSELYSLPRFSRVKLVAIRYKAWMNSQSLAGIQLCFTGGISSPLFQT